MREVPERLVADFPGRVRWTPRLTTPEVAAAIDASSALLLASRSEGLPRIVVEAFCRGRAVLGARGGGIPDIVVHGENGLLVPAEDADALAAAIVRMLSEPGLAERLGVGARRDVERWRATPEQHATRTRELVDRVTAGGDEVTA